KQLPPISNSLIQKPLKLMLMVLFIKEVIVIALVSQSLKMEKSSRHSNVRETILNIKKVGRLPAKYLELCMRFFGLSIINIKRLLFIMTILELKNGPWVNGVQINPSREIILKLIKNSLQKSNLNL